MGNYAQHFSTLTTPQTEEARPEQVENSAGGFVFALDKWKRLDRWLLLGCEGGTYYASEQKLTRENAKTVLECLAEDGRRTVDRIVEISDAGRAPKNDPAIFALAMAAGDAKLETRHYALAALPKVCRIGTHVFHFVRDVEHFRRWGRSLRTAVAKWYTDKPADKLAYDVLKYQQRDGWGHRDLLRLSHAQSDDAAHNAIFRWCVGAPLGERSVKRGKGAGAISSKYNVNEDALPAILAAHDQLMREPSQKNVLRCIREHGFTHEMIPTEAKNDPAVWEALLEKMPQTALIRNLAKMTAVKLFAPMGKETKKAAEMIANVDRLRKSRVHPIAILSALRVYQQGHGEKGKLTWDAAREIVDALDEAFYMAFQAVDPCGKNILLALDVSGSMDGGVIAGCPGITPRVAAGAMAMVTARVEKNWHIVAFTSNGNSTRGGYGGRWGGGSSACTPMSLSPKQRLDDVVRTMASMPMGGTDCALPMLYAAGNNIDVDCFQVMTDNETWAGTIHPFQALRAYREKSGKAAKLAVVAFDATPFTIADPSDAGMLDFVGFDTAAPALLADFARG